MVGAILPRETRAGWLSHAPAKLNVYLDVLGRRRDGFHEIETLLCPVRLFDTLLIQPTPDGESGSVAISVEPHLPGAAPQHVPTDDSNLVTRALRTVWDWCGVSASCRVRLTKRIPQEAGLGGGSSDAAAALIVANRAWRLGLGPDELGEVAAQVGSDVPGLLYGRPVVCRGRGEVVEPADVPSGIPCVIARPSSGLATAEVYRRCTPSGGGDSGRLTALVGDLRRGRLDRLRVLAANRLQPAAETLSQAIAGLRTMFSMAPCVAHQMTGSGSAYFGLCTTARQARRVAAWLRSQRVGWVTVSSTC